jgi:hypothetical protein
VGAGIQTIFPGSTHEDTGEIIAWKEEGAPTKIDDELLTRNVRQVAAAALFGRYWPAEGARHDAALALGGFLARCGFDELEIRQLVKAAGYVAGDVKESKNREECGCRSRSAGVLQRPAS